MAMKTGWSELEAFSPKPRYRPDCEMGNFHKQSFRDFESFPIFFFLKTKPGNE